VLFTVSKEVAQAAIAQVSSCEACNPDAADDCERDAENRLLLECRSRETCC
jgi:hypothetical protein